MEFRREKMNNIPLGPPIRLATPGAPSTSQSKITTPPSTLPDARKEPHGLNLVHVLWPDRRDAMSVLG